MILWMLDRRHRALLQRLFGSEYSAMRRFIELAGSRDEACSDDSPVELFMCAVGIDPQRKQVWDRALTALGTVQETRDSYNELYALQEFDGGTVAGYFDLWSALGLRVNEVDYGFFIDRATHFGGPWLEGTQILATLRACVAEEQGAFSVNGAARRCLSRAQPHPTQPSDRHARDVAFCPDDYPAGSISAGEIEAWSEFVPLSAVNNLGLSSMAAVQWKRSRAIATLGRRTVKGNSHDLTAAERKSCPAQIRAPLRE